MAVEPAPGAAGISSLAVRFAALLVTVGLALPLILFSVYMLAWFAPEVTAPGCRAASGWWDEYDSTILWLCSAAAVGLASASAIVSFRRVRTRRWRVWPLTTLAATGFMVLAVNAMDATAWCPPAPGLYGT